MNLHLFVHCQQCQLHLRRCRNQTPYLVHVSWLEQHYITLERKWTTTYLGYNDSTQAFVTRLPEGSTNKKTMTYTTIWIIYWTNNLLTKRQVKGAHKNCFPRYINTQRPRRWYMAKLKRQITPMASLRVMRSSHAFCGFVLRDFVSHSVAPTINLQDTNP